MATYEFWLCDDTGKRLLPLEKMAFVSYSRTTQGYGVIQLGIPLNYVLDIINPIFRPDWRIDVWRSAADGIPLKREGSFLLRKHKVYQRDDGMLMVDYWGRSPLDLLRRDNVRNPAYYTFSTYIDDIMKSLASMLILFDGPYYDLYNSTSYPDFTVEGNKSEGPTSAYDATNKNILDALQELKAISVQLNFADSTKAKILFDVIEVESSATPGGFGYKFVTYPNIRGADRTDGVVFSIENGNVKFPFYIEDHLDEQNYPVLFHTPDSTYEYASDASVRPTTKISRWNRCTALRTISTPGTDAYSLAELNRLAQENAAVHNFSCVFLNSPGSATQPRSLYGVDWNLGDLLPVQFAGKSFTAEVAIVYVALDDKGVESVTARTEVGSA